MPFLWVSVNNVPLTKDAELKFLLLLVCLLIYLHKLILIMLSIIVCANLFQLTCQHKDIQLYFQNIHQGYTLDGLDYPTEVFSKWWWVSGGIRTSTTKKRLLWVKHNHLCNLLIIIFKVPFYNIMQEPWLLHEFKEDFYGEELHLVIVGYIRPEV